MSAMAQDAVKSVTIAGLGYLYVPKTGELTEVHWSVSHRLSRSVTAMTFGLTFREPGGVVLKTDRYRHAFRYEHQSKLYGETPRRDDVCQVHQYSKVHGFCTSAGTCGTIQVRVLEVELE